MAELTTHDLLAEHLLRDDFVKASLSCPLDPHSSHWQKITVRKVELQRGIVLQIVRFDGKQTDTKSVDADDPLVAEVIAARYRHVTVHLTTAIVEGRVTKKGKFLRSRVEFAATTSGSGQDSSAHDRKKNRLVAETAPFLEVLGLASGGAVKPTGQRPTASSRFSLSCQSESSTSDAATPTSPSPSTTTCLRCSGCRARSTEWIATRHSWSGQTNGPHSWGGRD
jgi:hypothetical protein